MFCIGCWLEVITVHLIHFFWRPSRNGQSIKRIVAPFPFDGDINMLVCFIFKPHSNLQ